MTSGPPPWTLEIVGARLAAHEARDYEDGGADPRAAVAAILREAPERGGIDVMLIRRAEHPADPWSGHMALPGGRKDPIDETVLHTIVRETREEIGLDLRKDATLLGRLDEIHAQHTSMVVAPFVFRLDRSPELTPNHEVAEIVWGPLDAFASGAVDGTMPYLFKGTRVDLPCFMVGDRIVWGLTYRMLCVLLEVLGAR